MYFKKYNYEVKEQGETITFSGTYAASRGQAAALVFYVFCGKGILAGCACEPKNLYAFFVRIKLLLSQMQFKSDVL